MALTNQPYLPLFVNDWLSSTKLKMCSAKAHGIMINTMLLMHKEDAYGYILLKQKFKQDSKQVLNFASQLAKVLPFELLEIEQGLSELIDESCLYIDGDILKCNRMVKDADISIKRSLSGSKGGKETTKKISLKKKEFASNFAQANIQANSEYEIIIEIVNEVNTEFKIVDSVFQELFERWINYKKDKKQKYKSKDSLRTAYKNLILFSGFDKNIALEIIEKSIAANYTGFFKPNTSTFNQPTPAQQSLNYDRATPLDDNEWIPNNHQ